MLVKNYLIETRNPPTTDQVTILHRFGVTVVSPTKRRYFTARMTEPDATTLRRQHGDFVRAVSEDIEGTHCQP